MALTSVGAVYFFTNKEGRSQGGCTEKPALHIWTEVYLSDKDWLSLRRTGTKAQSFQVLSF
jgi:hypothetical protein